jgi:hypothetical protein
MYGTLLVETFNVLEEMQSNFSLAVMYLGDLFIGTEGLTYVFLVSTPVGWFYFLLHITITIINCNSLISDVGGCLLPRLSE